MRTMLCAVALLTSSMAVAQTATPPAAEPAPPTTNVVPEPPTPPTGDTTMPAPPSDTTAMPAPAAPAPAAAPAPTMGPMASAPPPAAPASYPRCSKTVTDACVQDSSRESDTKGGAPAHHRKKRRG